MLNYKTYFQLEVLERSISMILQYVREHDCYLPKLHIMNVENTEFIARYFWLKYKGVKFPFYFESWLKKAYFSRVFSEEELTEIVNEVESSPGVLALIEDLERKIWEEAERDHQ